MTGALSDDLALVGDIGGTNARLALATRENGAPHLFARQTYPCADYDGLETVVAAYLKSQAVRPQVACLAVAGAIVDGQVSMTNIHWTVSETGIEAAGVGRAHLINDFQALAEAAPWLEPADLHPLGADSALKPGSLAILGPGTGLGVSILARSGDAQLALGSEGGHISFAPTDALEVEIWRWLTRRFSRVSAERLICGPGLVNLDEALREIGGHPGERREAAEIVKAAREGEAQAKAAVDRFFALLGDFAGDVALMANTRGGVLIGGGMTPTMLDLIDPIAFRARFEAKGRFETLMRAIPTLVILRPDAALLGAAHAALDRVAKLALA